MKKVFLSIALMAVMFTTSAFASDSSEVLHKLNDRTTFNQLMRYLQVSSSQKEDLQYVFFLTGKRLDSVKNNQTAETEKALRFNLANTKLILSQEQYKKYLTILNVSVQNKDVSLVAER